MISNIIRNAKKTTAAATDPYFSSVSLLLHMDGANGSTSFVDSGPNALAVTASGNAQVTSNSKYGTGAGSFDGTNSYIQVGTSNDSRFLFGTGDFTIEFWCYVNAFSGTSIQTPINNYGSTITGWNIQLNCVNTNNVRLSYGDATVVMTTSNTISSGQWYHVAVTRSGTTAIIWINGVASATATNSTNISAASTLTIARVATGSTQYFNGKLDDLRVTKYARYTSAFTPPTQAFPNLYNPNTTLPVSGAALWLDASQQSSLYSDAGFTPVTTSGQSIYQWNDLSGNNRHAVQATSGNRPTWVPPASGQNGLGAVSFNGTSQRISTATSGLSAQPFEHYVVFKFNSTGTADRIVFGTVDRGNFDGNGLGGWNLYSGSLLAGGTRTGTSWAMANCKFNGSSSILRINASQVLSGNTGTGYPTAFSIAGNGSTDWGDITVAEFICYPSSLSTGDQNLVESYLRAKWGTP